MEQLKRCVLYLRVSSEGQRDNHSLPTQREGCLKFAGERGWRVVEVVEEVYTATGLDRPRLAEVRKRVAAGEADVVLVFDQDRLSRKARQTHRLLDELDEAGAEVWSVRQGKFELDAMGTFMTSARGFGAEMENEQRRERSMRAHRDRCEKGMLLGSSPKPRYGYRWPEEPRSDGRLKKACYEVDPATAPVIQRIFRDVANGVPLRRVATELTAEGVPTPTGKIPEWRHQTLREMLTEPMYCGEAWALARIRHRTAKVRNPKIVFDTANAVRLPEGTVPALIERATWEQVQEVLAENKRRGQAYARNPEQVLLRGGFVRCGQCGRAMVIAHRPYNKRSYRCNKMSNEAKQCPSPSPTISVDRIEPVVWRLVEDMLLNPIKMTDRYHSAEQHAVEGEQLSEARARLAGFERRRSGLLLTAENVDNEADAAALGERLRVIATERSGVQAEVALLERRLASRERGDSRLRRMAEWARAEQARVRTLSTDEKRGILRELGVEVRIYPTTAAERYTVAIGAKADPLEMLLEVDFSEMREPDGRSRLAQDQLTQEETERWNEARLMGCVSGIPTWEYWDEHVQEALVQHARVLGIEPINT